jgi:Sulfotransferase family
MPIIVGVPRSGTTLLRLMLDAHSELAITHEAGFVPLVSNLTNPLSRMFYLRFTNRSSDGPWPRLGARGNLREDFFNAVTTVKNWNDFHVPSEAFRQALLQLEPFTLSGGLRAFFRLYTARFGKPRWGDKTPFYNQYLQTVERMLPEAHFIHIIRDGRDAAASGKGLPFVGDDIEMIGRSWAQQIRETRRQAQKCRHYLEIRYEDLVLDTTEVLQKICNFIQLRYEPEMKLYHRNASERMNELESTYDEKGNVEAGKEARLFRHRLTAQPPEPTRIGRWKTALTAEELTRFKKGAGDLLQELGYE